MDKILHHLKDGLRLALELMRDIYDIKWLADFVYGQYDGFTYIYIHIHNMFNRLFQNLWHHDTKPGDWFKKNKKHGILALYIYT